MKTKSNCDLNKRLFMFKMLNCNVFFFNLNAISVSKNTVKEKKRPFETHQMRHHCLKQQIMKRMLIFILE